MMTAVIDDNNITSHINTHIQQQQAQLDGDRRHLPISERKRAIRRSLLEGGGVKRAPGQNWELGYGRVTGGQQGVIMRGSGGAGTPPRCEDHLHFEFLLKHTQLILRAPNVSLLNK
eukprot:966855-Prorocentrum_minimum.AAC.2